MVKGKRQLGVNTQTGELKIIREGKHNRERIYDFILKRASKEEGVKAGAIINNTGLSDQAVHQHLKILLNEKRIYKKGIRYYPDISVQNSFVSFANLMRDGAYYLIDKMSMESDPDANLPYELGKYPRLKLHQKIKVDIPEKLTMPIDFQHAPFLINSSMYLMKIC